MKAVAAVIGAITAMSVAGAVLAGTGNTGSSLSDKAQVFVLDGSGGGARQLTHGHTRSDIAWAPTSDRLATSFVSGIEVLSPDGRRLRSFGITHVQGEDALAWSPNGRALAFETLYDNRQTGAIDARLKSLSLRSGVRRRLSPMATVRPGWARNSRSLVYVRGDVVGVSPDECTPPPDRPPDPTCIPEKPVPEEVWRVGANGRGARRLVHNASSQFSPQLSPSGR